MTVAELIAILQTKEPDAVVGVVAACCGAVHIPEAGDVYDGDDGETKLGVWPRCYGDAGVIINANV